MEAPAESVLDRSALFFGHLGGLDDRFHAGHVDGHRLLNEGVFARFDSGAEILRPEVGRGAEKDDIHSGGDDCFVSIDAYELALLWGLHAFVVACADADCVLDSTFEGVTDRPKDDIGVGVHGLGECAASASSAADDTDFDLIGCILGFRNVRKGSSKGGRGAGFHYDSSLPVRAP